MKASFLLKRLIDKKEVAFNAKVLAGSFALALAIQLLTVTCISKTASNKTLNNKDSHDEKKLSKHQNS